MLFVQEKRAYTFMYNGKPRVAIVLDIDSLLHPVQALCWELTRNEFRRYNIKDIQSPKDVTEDKVLRFSNDYFVKSGRTSDELQRYYEDRDCLVFFGDEYTFVVNRKYLDKQEHTSVGSATFTIEPQFPYAI